jgi:hypothetical protein
MAHPKNVHVAVRAAYISGLPLEIAGQTQGVSLATARRWMTKAREKGDDWDKARMASLVVAGGGIEQALGRVIAAGLARCETLLEHTAQAENPMDAVKAMAVLGDTVAKLKSAAKGMMPQTDRLAVAMDVIERFSVFVTAQKPDLAPAFVELIEPFGLEIGKVYG